MAAWPMSAADSLHYAQVVGDTFVDQYYRYLRNSPELVHRFYHENSRLGRADEDGNLTSVTTIDAINEKILSMDFSVAEIKRVNCQDSLNGGVMVIVTGCFTREDKVKMDFIQSFFLAPQEKGYFVLNDILVYGSEVEHQQRQHGLSSGTGSPLASEHDSQQRESLPTDEIAAKTIGVSNPPSNGERSSLLAEELSNKGIDEVSDCDPPLPVKSKDTSAHPEIPKKSYASVLAQAKALKENVSAPDRPASYGPTSSSSAAESKKIQKPEIDSYSIYVTNLPSDATPDLLEEEFKRFGAIKPGGIQVRSHKMQSSCYGFVEFKLASSVRSAVEASPIIISRCNVYVKEKRILSSGVNNRERPAQNKTRGFWNGGTRENGDHGGWRTTAREGTESKHDSGSRVTSWKYSSNGGNVESL